MSRVSSGSAASRTGRCGQSPEIRVQLSELARRVEAFQCFFMGFDWRALPLHFSTSHAGWGPCEAPMGPPGQVMHPCPAASLSHMCMRPSARKTTRHAAHQQKACSRPHTENTQEQPTSHEFTISGCSNKNCSRAPAPRPQQCRRLGEEVVVVPEECGEAVAAGNRSPVLAAPVAPGRYFWCEIYTRNNVLRRTASAAAWQRGRAPRIRTQARRT